MQYKTMFTLFAAFIVLGFSSGESLAGSGCGSAIQKTSAVTSEKGCGDSSGDKCNCDHPHKKTEIKPVAGQHPVFLAEKLYTCPMHPEIVTEDADMKCPLCKMKLSQMTEKQVHELRHSDPKGCSMCPVVVKGNSKVDKCVGCKMALVELGKEKQTKEK